jgi:hypothetical protein
MEPSFVLSACGARGRNRTRDIFITSEVLYQLSYSGGSASLGRLAGPQENEELRLKVQFKGV